jgi:hypothetical protein
MNTWLLFALIVFIAALLYAHFALHLTLAEVKAKLHLIHTVIPLPAPAIESAAPPVDHGGTPPENANKTGSLVGKAVPGGTIPDADGCILIPAIAKKFAPGVRFMTLAALPFVPAGSAQAFAIAVNCANARMTLHIHGDAKAGAFGPEVFYCLPPVANPPSTAAVGGASFHLLGQVYGEKVAQNLPNAYAITCDLTTVDEIIAYYGVKDDWKPIDYSGSPVAGPGRGAIAGK